MAITRLGGANAITGTIPQGNIANASLGAVTALPASITTGKVLQVQATQGINIFSTTTLCLSSVVRIKSLFDICSLSQSDIKLLDISSQ